MAARSTLTSTRNEGKSMFVKEHLNDHPDANHRAVDEAWRAAGMSGSISPTLVSRVRSRMGLAGKRGGGGRRGTTAKATPTRAGRVASAPMPTDRGRKNHLMDLEVEIDRLLMKVAEIGTLPEVEDSLRRTRRELYAGLAVPS
jgi:hypothetical protein